MKKALECRKDFPFFIHPDNQDKIFFDNAATTQKPEAVLNLIRTTYETLNYPVHRSIYDGGNQITELYDNARKKIGDFITCKDSREIVFTKSTTDAINLVANSLGISKDDRYSIQAGDEVIVTIAEHHSNFIPWQELCKRNGATLKVVTINEEGLLDLEDLKKKITSNTKLIACNHVSNTLGTINPVKEISAIAKAVGAFFLIDGAQAVPHMKVNLAQIDCDFYAFSSHKMLGPAGIGVLYAKKEHLDNMEPVSFGGGMIRDVTLEKAEWADIPNKFEPGTQDICGVMALAYGAIPYLQLVGMDNLQALEQKLVKKMLHGLQNFKEIELYGPKDTSLRSGIVSFNIKKRCGYIDSDIAGALLDEKNIMLRTGKMCAHPLMNYLGVDGLIRASFYIYNNEEEVTRLLDSLPEVIENSL